MGTSRRLGRAPQFLIDGSAWVLGLWTAYGLRYEDVAAAPLLTGGLGAAALLAIAFQLAFGLTSNLYRGRYRYGSFEEVLGLALTVACSSLAVGVVNLLASPEYLVPRSTPFGGAVAAMLLMTGVRYGWRLRREKRRRAMGGGEPLLLFGAGEGADQVLLGMLQEGDPAYRPVGLLDDDSAKRRLRVRGVPVLGTRADLAGVAEKTGSRTLLIAVPSADAALVRDISALAEAADLRVKVLPSIAELIDRRVDVGDIRDLDLADLLGRRQIELDVGGIAGYLTGKRVLVTGAGGSIGSELCRQIATFAPAELIMLDRDESALHAVQLSIHGKALLDSDELVLADIRDIDHMERVFAERQPHVVFHAAALKHLTLLERFPGEAVKSNVWGTLTVLQAAAAHDVEYFVNISTDKAADPISVLGYSKRITERLTARVAQEARGCFVSVRFGNVLGSRGSVLTAFTAQVAAGGPVTVTHPDVTRYFMTVQEAVQLVIQAAAVGAKGQALILDMGAPVRIDDVARRLASQARRQIEIVYTGLRPGEKLHEDLLGAHETDERSSHPLVTQAPVPPVSTEQALALDPWAPSSMVTAGLRALALGADFEARFEQYGVPRGA